MRSEQVKAEIKIDEQWTLRRVLFLILAYLSLAMAVLGVLLPGLPATEFVLLSAWAATRSSPRLQRWLYQHRLFGPLLRDWSAGGRVSRRSKVIASCSMLVCFTILILHGPAMWLLMTAAGGMGFGAFWLWRRPEPEKQALARSSASI